MATVGIKGLEELQATDISAIHYQYTALAMKTCSLPTTKSCLLYIYALVVLCPQSTFTLDAIY